MESPIMSIPEVGEYLGYRGKSRGRSSVYEHIKNQRLVKVQILGRTFVTKDSADKLIRENTVRANQRKTGLSEASAS